MVGSLRGRLDDVGVPVRVKIAALWTVTMFCYVYGDYFGLFEAGTVAGMNAGSLGPLGPATPALLLGLSMMLAIPAVMIFLSLVLRPALARWLNVALGLVYTIIMLVSLPGSPLFYVVLGVLEMVLTMGVAWYAWRWPRAATGATETTAR